jgi:hypothetical protein
MRIGKGRQVGALARPASGVLAAVDNPPPHQFVRQLRMAAQAHRPGKLLTSNNTRSASAALSLSLIDPRGNGRILRTEYRLNIRRMTGV